VLNELVEAGSSPRLDLMVAQELYSANLRLRNSLSWWRRQAVSDILNLSDRIVFGSLWLSARGAVSRIRKHLWKGACSTHAVTGIDPRTAGGNEVV